MSHIKKKISASVITVIIICSTVFFDSGALTTNDPDDVININVLPLIKQNVNVGEKYTGYVVPIKSVDVMANVSGYIDEIWATGGNKVEFGDNLLLIDQKQLKAEVDALKAAKSMASANFVNARNYYDRIKKAGNNATSPAQRDEAKAKFLSAEAELKQNEAELKKAMVMLDYTVIQASIDGILGDVNLTKGNFVSAGQTKLFSIIQQSPIRVKFAVSNKDYISNWLNYKNNLDNLVIKIVLADNSVYQHEGKFAYFDNQIDKKTSSVNVFADFENPDNLLMANSYVDVLVEKKLKNVFLIKQNYASLNDNGTFVNIVKNNKIRKEKLNIVGYLDDALVVDNNFAKSDFLITGNIPEIKNKTKVKVKPIIQNTGAK